MSASDSNDIFIECKGCGVENFFGGHVPGTVLVCNQCRDLLVSSDMEDTHSAFECDDCGLILLLLKETEVTPGESTCRCGGSNLSETDTSIIASDFLDFVDEDDDEPLEDTDWLRESSGNPDDDDYNDMFDQGPGMA